MYTNAFVGTAGQRPQKARPISLSVVKEIEPMADGRTVTWARVTIDFPTGSEDRIDNALKLAQLGLLLVAGSAFVLGAARFFGIDILT